MNSLKLLKRGPISKKGIYDATVLINGKDCGVLYLTEAEKDVLLDQLIHGRQNENVEFETDLYQEDTDDYI
jgi:hypothetical protein